MFCQSKNLHAPRKNTINAAIEMGTKIIFEPDTAFKPALAAIAAGIIKSNTNKDNGVLLKYTVFKLLAKYLTHRAEKERNNNTYEKAIIYFKKFPPK